MATLLLTTSMILIIGALAIAGYFHYRRTGTLLASLPKLPSLSSLVKSSANESAVTFRSGVDINMDFGVSGLGPKADIDRSMAMSEHFVMETGKQPMVCENPMYATRDSAVNVTLPTLATKLNYFKQMPKQDTNFENPIYGEEKEEKEEKDGAAAPHLSSSVPAEIPQSRDQLHYLLQQKILFIDNSTLLREESEV